MSLGSARGWICRTRLHRPVLGRVVAVFVVGGSPFLCKELSCRSQEGGGFLFFAHLSWSKTYPSSHYYPSSIMLIHGKLTADRPGIGPAGPVAGPIRIGSSLGTRPGGTSASRVSVGPRQGSAPNVVRGSSGDRGSWIVPSRRRTVSSLQWTYFFEEQDEKREREKIK
ncbi:hypothetical protein CTA1_2154 [Colletotrichum tanaceti]|uniref:Uncharacterized protein n=1 Tax=Colletotrichum tanaceti TaxID=1306861 RepID=A0A4U6X0T6_9PEZI|nr:hypothetical protein CTA1_2154 [Colletotrichum tanaceti]